MQREGVASMLDYLAWIIGAVTAAAAGGYSLGVRAGRPMPAGRAACSPRLVGDIPQQASADTRASLDGPGAQALLRAVRSWAFQLQDIDVAAAAASPHDMLIIDRSRDGREEHAFFRAEVSRMQRKPDGGRRLVLACCSIGMAESFRGYWRSAWATQKPDWLLDADPDNCETRFVRFWHPGWQRLLFGTADAEVDRILARGFDGICLDACDVTADIDRLGGIGTRLELDRAMVALARRISSYAKHRRPGFLVLIQNAEALLACPELRQSIDGVVKEDLFFGLEERESENRAKDIRRSLRLLDLARGEGMPIFLVEYLASPDKSLKARAAARRLGFPLYRARPDRALDHLESGP
jgi:cysteinyl-tRNA synthetase